MLLRDFFIQLSENQLLNSTAKKYGLKLGAQSVVAGTNIEETIASIKDLNAHNISCTVDNLGNLLPMKKKRQKLRNKSSLSLKPFMKMVWMRIFR